MREDVRGLSLAAAVAILMVAVGCPGPGGTGGTGGGSGGGGGTTGTGGGTGGGTTTGDGGTGGGTGGGTTVPFDAGRGTGCLDLETTGGACLPLVFSNLCSLPKLTVVQSGNATDDAAGAALAAGVNANCPTALPLRSVNGKDGQTLTADGAPVGGHLDVLVVGGGSFNQKHVDWVERIAGSPVFDSTHDPVVAMTRRDTGTEIFSEAATAIGPSHDYALIELFHAQVGGPMSFIGYGFYGPGTTAAAWYFQNVIAKSLSTHTDSWYVVRWSDMNGDMIPNLASEFTLVASGH